MPNTEWLQGSGLALHDGNVLCDSRCFAAGHHRTALLRPVTWPRGRIRRPTGVWSGWSTGPTPATWPAGRSGISSTPASKKDYASVPSFWSDQYDVKIKSAGIWSLATQVTVVEEDPATGVLVAEGACDQGLVGALVVNKNKSFIAYKRLLAENYRSRSPASPGPDPRLTPLPART